LLEIQTDKTQGHISLIGNDGWCQKDGEKARFDQQALEIPALIVACYEAYRSTGNVLWREEMERVFSWFMGKNDLNRVVYDFSTGGCFDGLESSGINRNQGAESTLSWLLAVQRMYIAIEEENVAVDK